MRRLFCLLLPCCLVLSSAGHVPAQMAGGGGPPPLPRVNYAFIVNVGFVDGTDEAALPDGVIINVKIYSYLEAMCIYDRSQLWFSNNPDYLLEFATHGHYYPVDRFLVVATIEGCYLDVWHEWTEPVGNPPNEYYVKVLRFNDAG